MPFHRFKDPTYFESTPGFPGTIDGIAYDRINVGDGLIAAPGAPADAAKVGGNAPGTYWVDQGEIATGFNTNRGMRALSENADHMDDLLHRDLATPATQTESPGGPITDFTITGEVFVGSAGATDDQQTRSGLVQILDSSGQPLHVLDSGEYKAVKVTDIEAVLSGGTVVGNGYEDDPVISVDPAIPAGTYEIVFYERKSPASQAEGMVSELAKLAGNWESDLWALTKNSDVFANVKTHGAVGDGVADDTAAINTALAFAGPGESVVYFPKGRYRVTSAITVPVGVSLWGAGAENSVITIDHATANLLVMSGSTTNLLHGQSFKNLLLTADQANTGAMIQFPDVSPNQVRMSASQLQLGDDSGFAQGHLLDVPNANMLDLIRSTWVDCSFIVSEASASVLSVTAPGAPVQAAEWMFFMSMCRFVVGTGITYTGNLFDGLNYKVVNSVVNAENATSVSGGIVFRAVDGNVEVHHVSAQPGTGKDWGNAFTTNANADLVESNNDIKTGVSQGDFYTGTAPSGGSRLGSRDHHLDSTADDATTYSLNTMNFALIERSRSSTSSPVTVEDSSGFLPPQPGHKLFLVLENDSASPVTYTFGTGFGSNVPDVVVQNGEEIGLSFTRVGTVWRGGG